jgi:hypothetical protein
MTPKTKSTLFAFTLCSLLFYIPLARAATSTFNSGSEGWSVVSFSDLPANNYSVAGSYGPTYNANGGNPGGYISSTDPDGGYFMFSAPSSFLGNQSAAFGTNFTYDITHSGAIDFNTTDLMLVGNGIRLLWQSSTPLMPGPAWLAVSVALAPSAQWRVNTTSGAFATTADFQNVLANLTGIFIRGEYTSGPEQTGLDNVQLGRVAAAPAPDAGNTIFLFAFAAMALGAVERLLCGAARN